MFEITGKHNSAKIFANTVDETTISQIYGLCGLESLSKSKIRIMPDCHAGTGCVIGTTMTIRDAIIPNLVGVDIGCGMLAMKLKERDIDLAYFDHVVRTYVPSGANIHDAKDYPVARNHELKNLKCFRHCVNEAKAQLSLGTLGGGNHFIELDRDSNENVWLVIHTGSRHLGIEVCNYYQKQAYKALIRTHMETVVRPEIDEAIKNLKEQSRTREIEKTISAIHKKHAAWTPSVSPDLAACTGQLLHDYLHDMQIVQWHAKLNRQAIASTILCHANLHDVEQFDTIHNYIGRTDHPILRKGAISAQLGEKVLIPMNMRDGNLICLGKGNIDWNCSAPHGAGRLYSRADAKEQFSIKEYETSMTGIFTTSVNRETLDECPMAYKPMEEIIHTIQDTIEIIDIIKPIYNFKA